MIIYVCNCTCISYVFTVPGFWFLAGGLPYLSLQETEDEKASFSSHPLEALAPSPVKVCIMSSTSPINLF